MSLTVLITTADVRDAVESLAKEKGRTGVIVDAVVAELQARLNLVREHPATTALNWSNVLEGLKKEITDRLGDQFDKILDANSVE